MIAHWHPPVTCVQTVRTHFERWNATRVSNPAAVRLRRRVMRSLSREAVLRSDIATLVVR